MKKIVFGMITLLLLFIGCSNKKCSTKPKAAKITKKIEKKIIERDVTHLKVESYNGLVKLSWQLNRNDDIKKIMVLRKVLNDGNPDKIYKRVMFAKPNETNVEFEDEPLAKVSYKVKLIGINGGKSKGVQIETFINHKNVISDKFEEKDLFVYLPDSYYTSKDKRYPVIYMCDAQNLFSKYQAPDEWGMDENLAKLKEQNKIDEMIVVGMFHGNENRFNEYMPYSIYSGNEFGDKFAVYIANSIVPYIDEKYRTVADRENRMIMGSSMGGIFSMYTIAHHYDVFSSAGVVSPWFPKDLLDDMASLPKREGVKIWIDAGTIETHNFGNYAIQTRELVDLLIEKGYNYGKELFYYEVKDGDHSEMDWRLRVEYPIVMFKGLKEMKLKDYELQFEEAFHNIEERNYYYLNAVAEYENGLKYSLYNLAEFNCLSCDYTIVSKTGKIDIDEIKPLSFQAKYNGMIKEVTIN